MQVSRPRLVFTLAVLTAINTLNFFDRQILPAVQEKIRHEWSLSDSQLGWLGTAFILLYAIVGVPLGRWADVGPRKWILAGGVALWSLLTFGSGIAWNFWSLFVMRLGVGVGEASCAPVATSMIGDLVGPRKRARALGLFMLGLPLGLALSYVVSGTVAERYSWQIAFFIAGGPGLVLALLALLLADVRSEHPSTGNQLSPSMNSTPSKTGTSFRQAVGIILGLPTMWWIIFSGAIHNFNMYALGSFLASLLKRYHHLTVEEAGWVTGLIFGFGALGLFASGWLGDWAFHRWISGRLQVAWICTALAIPCLFLALAARPGEVTQCAVWLIAGYMLCYCYYGTVYAAIQDIIEPSLRGTAMAIYFFAMYFLGAMLGPVGVGWLSDWSARRVAARFGQSVPSEVHVAQGLHEAMYAVPLLAGLLVVVLFAATQTFATDYERRHQRERLAQPTVD
ncbi:MAG: MFS transporter [Gemmatales bacterium]|nr:MFS transporter [Gemmatales bacterium]MDW8387178.1 MFS transporter [Gemmatales bacterium]